MRIVIVGCGKIGQSILQSLISEGHEIVVVDNDREVIDNVTTSYDVMGICAAGTHFKTLSDADVGSAELFIAATGSDEINMLSCFLAKRMGAKHTVARIRGSEYSSENLGFIKKQLELRYFTPKITGINKVKEEYGYSYWDVATDRGPCRFTADQNGVVKLSQTRLIINDVDGNRFELPDVTALSSKELRMIDLYI